MEELVWELAFVFVLSIPLWFAISVAEEPVPFGRVAAFERRHQLVLTVPSGNHVIAYLAITRRWRAFGLAVGVVISVVAGLPGFTINSFPLFAGWFVGALVAELRVLPPRSGPRRVALVAPRRLATYLSRPARTLLPAATALAVLIGLSRPLTTLPWTVSAVAVALAVWLIERRVLHRSQPLAQADLLAADDAIRSRSLHVLAGGGTALVLFLVLSQLSRLGVVSSVPGFAGFLFVSLLGWSVATSRWLVVRAA